jgi:formylglycine-generating enzyme required for sulfatase activity
LKSAQKRPIEFEWIDIPAGDFLMGNNPLPDTVSYPDESPEHSLFIDSFEISQTPITNEQYWQFTNATGYKTPAHWRNGKPSFDYLKHPVTYVDWEDAQAFSTWCGVQLPRNGRKVPEVLLEISSPGVIHHQMRRLQIMGTLEELHLQ